MLGARDARVTLFNLRERPRETLVDVAAVKRICGGLQPKHFRDPIVFALTADVIPNLEPGDCAEGEFDLIYSCVMRTRRHHAPFENRRHLTSRFEFVTRVCNEESSCPWPQGRVRRSTDARFAAPPAAS